MQPLRRAAIAPLCLVCHAPVGRDDPELTLHCSRLCHLVWRALLQISYTDSARAQSPAINAVLSKLQAGNQLTNGERARLQLWLWEVMPPGLPSN